MSYSDSESYKIFIIDDSVFIRNSLMDLLPELGFDVVGMASSAKDGFKYVAETRPDLVLLDTSIPEFTTQEIIRGLLAINKNLEIIVLSPLSDQNSIANYLRVGARDYIPKPLVARQVEYVLRGYELSAGIRPPTEIQTIAQLYTIYFEELMKHAPENVVKLMTSAIYTPLKRLRRSYKDRYQIFFDPIRINLIQAQSTHTEKIYKMYKRQLSRLFLSVANKLNKELPKEYVISLLIEAYQSYYPLARHLLEHVEFRLPIWEGYDIEPSNRSVLDQRRNARFDYIYISREEAML